MNTNREVFRNSSSTLGAELSSVFGWNFNYRALSFFRFSLQDRKKPEPSHIPHLSRESMVIAIEGRHVLNADSIVVFEKLVGNLEVKVSSLIVHLLKGLGDKNSSLLSAVRAFLSVRQSLLPLYEYILGCLEESGIAYLHTIGGSKKGFKPHIYTHAPASGRQGFGGHIIAGKAHIPLVSCTPADGNGLDYAFNWSRQPEFESANLANSEIFAFQFPTSLFQCKAIIPVPTLKSGESWLFTILHPAKEGLVGFIKPLQDVLKYLRANFGVFRKNLFEVRKLLHLAIARDRAFILAIDHYSLLKGAVIKVTTQGKPSFGFLENLLISQKTIFETLFSLHNLIMAYFKKGVKPIHPTPEGMGFFGLIL